MALVAGARIGPYEIVAPLGAGGMGEVYRARDSRLERDVALKFVLANRAHAPEAAARFEREWHAVARLSHPNIVALHDVGHQDGVTFAVMELVPGETLRQRLSSGPLTPRKAIDFGVQIARGLDAAHRAGIVHRDLKPENVVVTPDGHVKILDFGLARPADAVAETATLMTGPGTVLGTGGYMAPEQARAEAVDHRTDIFAFGAVLYEMLTGRLAFGGATAVERVHAVLTAEPDVDGLAPTNPGLRHVVMRCLEKRPDDRFSSAHDLAYALEAAGQSSASSLPLTAPAAGSSRWLRYAAGATGCAAILVAGVALGRGFAPRPATSGEDAPMALRAQIAGPPGYLNELAFSQTGERLAAVVAGADGLSTIWARAAAGTEWRQIAATNMRYQAWCAWAPDSRSLAYPALVDGSTKLKVIDLDTGAASPRS